jgi:YVTN family beta-propeller protein
MFVISPDGRRLYTANNEAGSVSVLDLRARTLLTTIPISAYCQLRVRKALRHRDGQWSAYKTFDTPDVPVLLSPGEFALSADGIHAYVTCPQGGTIEILNLKDWKMEEPIRLTKGVDGMAWVSSATR